MAQSILPSLRDERRPLLIRFRSGGAAFLPSSTVPDEVMLRTPMWRSEFASVPVSSLHGSPPPLSTFTLPCTSPSLATLSRTEVEGALGYAHSRKASFIKNVRPQWWHDIHQHPPFNRPAAACIVAGDYCGDESSCLRPLLGGVLESGRVCM